MIVTPLTEITFYDETEQIRKSSAMKLTSIIAVLITLAAVGLSPTSVDAQQPSVHYQYSADMPPGAIGRWQLLRGGPVSGYFQPVKLTAPEGVFISSVQNERFSKPKPEPMTAGLLIGHVYRFQITRIPFNEGQEVYPTIEIIDRLYPPVGKKTRYPIPIQLTLEELEMALEGKFVTRVIYLEPPQTALPVAEIRDTQRYFEVKSGEDPLQTADLLGRPVAILRMGSRIPDRSPLHDSFFFGSPPIENYSLKNHVKTEAKTVRQSPTSTEKRRPLQLLRSLGSFPLLSQHREKKTP